MCITSVANSLDTFEIEDILQYKVKGSDQQKQQIH